MKLDEHKTISSLQNSNLPGENKQRFVLPGSCLLQFVHRIGRCSCVSENNHITLTLTLKLINVNVIDLTLDRDITMIR